jgi:hypothetical protein
MPPDKYRSREHGGLEVAWSNLPEARAVETSEDNAPTAVGQDRNTFYNAPIPVESQTPVHGEDLEDARDAIIKFRQDRLKRKCGLPLWRNSFISIIAVILILAIVLGVYYGAIHKNSRFVRSQVTV